MIPVLDGVDIDWANEWTSDQHHYVKSNWWRRQVYCSWYRYNVLPICFDKILNMCKCGLCLAIKKKARWNITIKSSKEMLCKNNLDNNWWSHVVLSIEFNLALKWNKEWSHNREPSPIRQKADVQSVRVCTFFRTFSTIFFDLPDAPRPQWWKKKSEFALSCHHVVHFNSDLSNVPFINGG